MLCIFWLHRLLILRLGGFFRTMFVPFPLSCFLIEASYLSQPNNTRWLSPSERRLAQIRLAEDAGEADEDSVEDS